MLHQPGTRLPAAHSPSTESHALEEVVSSVRPSAADIRRELQRVVDSVAFDASDRNRRFLQYVVEETLEGRSDRIKAYNVATIVFGRDVNFDPQLDPVVRMEAQRLRRSLERFYMTEGKGSKVWISLPKGSYVPQFHFAVMASPRAFKGLSLHASGPVAVVLVTAFDDDGGEPAWHRHESGLAFQLMIGLSAQPHVSVLCGGGVGWRHDSSQADFATSDADFILTGSKALFADIIQVKAVLLDASTGKVLWGRSFEQTIDPEGVMAARDKIAKTIVEALVQSGQALGPDPFGLQGNG